MKEIVASILQSSYVPWKGYFDIISRSDYFFILDCVQYTKNDWRNRNIIKTAHGCKWLTIPVRLGGRFGLPIDEVRIARPWARQHLETLLQSYARAPALDRYRTDLRALYDQAASLERLTEVNELFLRALCAWLGIATPIMRAGAAGRHPDRNQRLVDLCRSVGATRYLSGPRARAYLDEALFHSHGIQVDYMNYGHYPVYPQLHGDFVHEVSVLDLLLTMGDSAPDYLQSGGRQGHD